MRFKFKMSAALVFVLSLSVFAGAGAARGQAQNPPDQTSPAQDQQPAGPVVRGQRRLGPGPVTHSDVVMTPGMMQAMGPMLRTQNAGGPLQSVSRFMTAIDDPRTRAALGITDQQADSLRKIVTDTEIFTIQTGANIAVDSIELKELLRVDKPDRAAVTSKGNEISKDTSQLIGHYLDAILAAKTILTPEQQKALRAYLENGAPALPAPPTRP
jgi:Spy/CpxP family protein refolding chaperone